MHNSFRADVAEFRLTDLNLNFQNAVAAIVNEIQQNMNSNSQWSKRKNAHSLSSKKVMKRIAIGPDDLMERLEESVNAHASQPAPMAVTSSGRDGTVIGGNFPAKDEPEFLYVGECRLLSSSALNNIYRLLFVRIHNILYIQNGTETIAFKVLRDT